VAVTKEGNADLAWRARQPIADANYDFCFLKQGMPETARLETSKRVNQEVEDGLSQLTDIYNVTNQSMFRTARTFGWQGSMGGDAPRGNWP
jgi:hypothetical protein